MTHLGSTYPHEKCFFTLLPRSVARVTSDIRHDGIIIGILDFFWKCFWKSFSLLFHLKSTRHFSVHSSSLWSFSGFFAQNSIFFFWMEREFIFVLFFRRKLNSIILCFFLCLFPPLRTIVFVCRTGETSNSSDHYLGSVRK